MCVSVSIALSLGSLFMGEEGLKCLEIYMDTFFIRPVFLLKYSV